MRRTVFKVGTLEIEQRCIKRLLMHQFQKLQYAKINSTMS